MLYSGHFEIKDYHFNHGVIVNKLPIKLQIEPLVDAVFEVRFTGAPTISPILPCLLYKKLINEVK